MTIAIWIIAVCEIIRVVQNIMQLYMVKHDTGARDDAYKAFVDAMKVDDREFMRNIFRELEKADEVTE